MRRIDRAIGQPHLALDTQPFIGIVGTIAVVFGLMMLLVPYHFSASLNAVLRPILVPLGFAFFAIGCALRLAQEPGLSPRFRAMAWVASSIVFGVLAGEFGRENLPAAMMEYAILATGCALAAAIKSEPGPGRVVDLHTLVTAFVGIAMGLVMLAFPALYPAPPYTFIGPLIIPYGIVFLISGALTFRREVSGRPPDRVTAVAGLCLIGLNVWFAYNFGLLHGWTGLVLHLGLAAGLVWAHVRRSRSSQVPARGERRDLARRLALVMVVMTTIPLVAATAVGFSGESRDDRNRALEDQRVLAVTVANAVGEFLVLHRSAVSALAAQPGLSELAPAAQKDLLQQVGAQYPDVVAFGTADANGNPIARSIEPLGPSGANQPFFQEVRQTGRPSHQVIMSPIIHRPIVVLASPVYGPDRGFAGAVVASVETTRVTALMEQASAGLPVSILLVTEDGRLIAQAGGTAQPVFSDLSESPPVAAQRSDPSGKGSLSYSTGSDTMLSGYARTADLGWGVVVTEPEQVALSGTRERQDVAFLILIGAILGAAVLGNLAAQYVTAPLRTVSNRIRALARGDTVTAAPRSDIGEIAALEDAFDAAQTELATLSAAREQAQQERDRHAEEASKRAALLDLAHDAIFEKSTETRTIRFWNAGAERLYGYSRDVALGQDSHALLHTIYPMEEATIYEIVRRTGFWEGELTRTTGDGTTIVVESRWALKRASRGDPEAILEIDRDITARKAAQDALARSNADLQQFGYTVSHDLKAPLVSIQGFADRLHREYGTSLDTRALHMLTRIGVNAGRLCQLIDEVMVYSRFGRVDAPLAPVDLAEAIQGATEALRHQIEQSGASIVLVTPLPVILTVPTFLDQILTNLLANALTYGSRSDESPRVEVGCVAVSGGWRLFVRDHGPGIPPDQIQRLFRLFERLPDSKARNPKGNGAGLSIVRRAIEAMGGRVGVESPVGAGATFWVEFPQDPGVLLDGPAWIAGDSLNGRQNGAETKN